MTAAAAHPGAERIELWFMDGWALHASNRIGQKGRTTHLWYERGVRPRGAHAVGVASNWLFAAACPERDAAVGLVLPAVSTAAMNLFLAAVAQDVPPGTHAVLVLDQAGWHASRGLAVPPNLTLVPLPPSNPELNPVEKLWQFVRGRLLSHRVVRDRAAVVAAACAAWNRLLAEPGRLRSLTAFPWLPSCVTSS